MGKKEEIVLILAKSLPSRKEFHLAAKESKESPEEWLCRVKLMAESCSFGKSYNWFVLDKFLTGFEAEIIDHLCSSAEYLDINSSLQIIHANDIKEEVTLVDPVAVKPEQTEMVFSEILVKGDANDIPDDTSSIGGDGLDFLDDSNESFDDNSKDSDFHYSEFEETNTNKLKRTIKATKQEPKPKKEPKKQLKKESKKDSKKESKKEPKKEPKKKLKTEKKETEQSGADPKAPKKRRNYKQRPIKEKQVFECDICQYKVNHLCHLRRHMLIHLNQKSQICHICGKGFNLFVNLNAHLRRHAGYKPHECEVCKATFIDKTRLRLHIRTHTGERPYGCDFCNKKFADRYYLKVHMRLHTGERPFVCGICNKSFSQSSSLSVHKKKNCLINPACRTLTQTTTIHEYRV